jgi:hypothetical protein
MGGTNQVQSRRQEAAGGAKRANYQNCRAFRLAPDLSIISGSERTANGIERYRGQCSRSNW